MVDLPAASIPANQPGAPACGSNCVIGASPLNLRATTLGDELRLATNGHSRVYGISLKDRAAILPAGQSANGAYWIDNSSGQFTTSTYYMEHLPEWARAFNAGDRPAQAAREANAEGTTQFYELVGRTPAANSYELDFAKALIIGEKLGQNGVTDLVVVSLSPNDIQGHQFGPDSDFEEQMILILDRDLDSFNSWLDQTLGLENVWLALTADHGIAPIPGDAAKLGIHAAAVNMDKVYDAAQHGIEQAPLRPARPCNTCCPNPTCPTSFSTSGRSKRLEWTKRLPKTKWLHCCPRPWPASIRIRRRSRLALRPCCQPSQERLPTSPHVQYVYTRLQLASGALPPSEWGRLLAHSYAEHGNWYVMLVLDAYQMQGSGAFAGTTHFSPWSYDRHVPLAFYGAPFIPSEYHERVAPVDLAATLASLAGINQPSAAVGRVLQEAIKPAAGK